VESTDTTGKYTSIAVDAAGNPWVSFNNEGDGVPCAPGGGLNCRIMVAWYVGSGGDCDDAAWSCSVLRSAISGDGFQYTSLALDHSGSPWFSYYDATSTNLAVAKMHLPPTKLTRDATMLYSTRSAITGDARYRMDSGYSDRSLATCNTGNNSGYCGVASDDAIYDSSEISASTSQRPLFTFASRNTNNTDEINPTYLFRTGTTNDPSDLSITLEIYRAGTTNAWETVQTDSSTTDCNTTDCTLSGSITTNLSEYYHDQEGSNYWAYFRVWQTEDGTNTQNLRTDTFSAGFGAASVDISGVLRLTNESGPYLCATTGNVTVELRVNGAGTDTTTCTADTGAYAFTGLTAGTGTLAVAGHP